MAHAPRASEALAPGAVPPYIDRRTGFQVFIPT
jgi:hypothetical protein